MMGMDEPERTRRAISLSPSLPAAPHATGNEDPLSRDGLLAGLLSVASARAKASPPPGVLPSISRLLPPPPVPPAQANAMAALAAAAAEAHGAVAESRREAAEAALRTSAGMGARAATARDSTFRDLRRMFQTKAPGAVGGAGPLSDFAYGVLLNLAGDATEAHATSAESAMDVGAAATPRGNASIAAASAAVRRPGGVALRVGAGDLLAFHTAAMDVAAALAEPREKGTPIAHCYAAVRALSA